MVISCKCGLRTYASMDEARAAEPNGAYKCEQCHTFATDHFCYCDDFSDYRCYDCDTRHGSHGEPRAA